MRFSVIIPLYNCEQYIEECVASLQLQTFQNFEIIVVNDGSTDCSLELIETIEDSRMKIVSQANKGLFHARLAGLTVATGEYCLFLDADDLLRSDALEELDKCFKSEYDCAIYKTALFFDGKEEKIIKQSSVLPDKQQFDLNTKVKLIELLLTTSNMNSIVCKAFKRKMINVRKLESYPRIAIGEDALFTMELFENISTAIYLDEGFYFYRQQTESMTHKLTKNIYYDNIFRFEKYYIMAEEYFVGGKLSEINNRIDEITCRMISSLALNPRFAVIHYSDYYKIMMDISENQYFKLLNKRISKEKLFYRVVLFCVNKKWYWLLYISRHICQKFLRIIGVKI